MSLKKSNMPTVTILLVVNVALFIVFSQGTSDFWNSLGERIHNLKSTDSLFVFLTPLLLSIANGFLSASIKAALVFGRIENPLPGCRVFSDLAPRDQRINMEQLKQRLGSLPTSPGDQNSTWYQLYKQTSGTVAVKESHRQFLLNRDLTGISALFFLFGSLALFPAGANYSNILIYSILTLSEFLIFSTIARNNGNRFVCNVLAEL